MNPRVTSKLHPVGTHLPVIEDKETTRVRIVCYSVTIYGGMGNNSFLPEPKLSKMFFYALLRFRSYLVALVADLTGKFLTSYRGKARPLPVGVEVTPL